MTGRIEDNFKSGIYCIRNIINNKVYIGQSKNIYRRILTHICNLNAKNKNAENEHIIKAWSKYGRNNFEYFVLEYTDKDPKLLGEREVFWINKFNSNNRFRGYNCRDIVDTYQVVSEETRKKLSYQSKKRMSTIEARLSKSKQNVILWKNAEFRNKVVQSKIKFKIIKQICPITFEVFKEYSSFNAVVTENPSYNINHIYNVATKRKKGKAYGYYWEAINSKI